MQVLALGIDGLGIQSLEALATHWAWLGEKVLGSGVDSCKEKPSPSAEGVFTASVPLHLALGGAFVYMIFMKAPF